MNADDLVTGVIACVQSGEAWPPSLPEFRTYCRPAKRENAAAYRYSGPMLPHKLDDAARAKACAMLASIRKGLNVNTLTCWSCVHARRCKGFPLNEKKLWCAKHQRAAVERCKDFEYEPGSDEHVAIEQQNPTELTA